MSIPAAPLAAPLAVYWDFENLHARLVEDRLGDGAYNTPDGRFKAQEPLVQVQKVVDFVATLGPVALNRAYCNWQYFGRYREALLGAGMDLVQLFPPGASAKNGADIRLCLDALEDSARVSMIGQVVIVGGDSDFMPLAQKPGAATCFITTRTWSQAERADPPGLRSTRLWRSGRSPL
jgi:NYN domain